MTDILHIKCVAVAAHADITAWSSVTFGECGNGEKIYLLVPLKLLYYYYHLTNKQLMIW